MVDEALWLYRHNRKQAFGTDADCLDEVLATGYKLKHMHVQANAQVGVICGAVLGRRDILLDQLTQQWLEAVNGH